MDQERAHFLVLGNALADCEHLLLHFRGPVCDLSVRSVTAVTGRLRDLLAGQGVPLPQAVRAARSGGRDATVQLRGLATQSEPPQVSGLPVARIQWHRTSGESFTIRVNLRPSVRSQQTFLSVNESCSTGILCH